MVDSTTRPEGPLSPPTGSTKVLWGEPNARTQGSEGCPLLSSKGRQATGSPPLIGGRMLWGEPNARTDRAAKKGGPKSLGGTPLPPCPGRSGGLPSLPGTLAGKGRGGETERRGRGSALPGLPVLWPAETELWPEPLPEWSRDYQCEVHSIVNSESIYKGGLSLLNLSVTGGYVEIEHYPGQL